ncbi:phosphoadenosine phosphosulfate reductase family protein [Endozoicomonas sp. ISHI1]|uniref:phosphoadenosine phosphosulfate reductase family protein n=1 Tax=Endozoicomonas sp. ISHI1 TaxID=2825882 RepID=UPI0021495D2D|nr:phosphoadenosine phosphosulfate reductase family protein [Endozoicomonas sp. ISHI1]
MTEPRKIKHVLGLSGGKDSAALAIYMRDTYPDLDIEYFFTDTGKELPEVYDYFNKLEAYLGKDIARLNDDKGFDYWLKQFNNFLPSAQQRWCTIQMKLKPFEEWVKPLIEDGYEIVSYVGIRADEPYRDGYVPTEKFLKVRMPFVEDGLNKQDIINILNNTGLGLPKYYEWRSRSGCTFCFYQRKIEWVKLKERHPEAFEEAKCYEKHLNENASGEKYYWLGMDTPLNTLEDPKRIEEIKRNHEKALKRFEKKRRRNALYEEELIEMVDLDAIYDEVEGGGACITCYK